MTTLITRLIRPAIVLLAGISLLSCSSNYEFDYLYEDLPFEMTKVVRPQIPAREVSVDDFGGKGDGVFLNTQAFADAIDALSQLGGGRLVVPTGIWLTGPITLKDNIELHVRPDAVLLFSTDRSLYPIVETVFEGLDTKRCLAPINADGARNISKQLYRYIKRNKNRSNRCINFYLFIGKIFYNIKKYSGINSECSSFFYIGI